MANFNPSNKQIQIEYKKQKIVFSEHALDLLYPGQTITDDMKNIEIKWLKKDYKLENILGIKTTVIHHYAILINKRKEQALISFKLEDNCNNVEEINIYLPFSNRIFINDKINSDNFITKNIDNGKEGLFTLSKSGKFEIEEKYDAINKGINGYLITLNNKIGRINHYNREYNIPAKYDELIEIDYSARKGAIVYGEKNNLVLVRLDDKWGCYCYIQDYYYRYDYINDRGFNRLYLKKRFIQPLFDKIDLYHIDTDNAKIILKVWLNKKCGLLDAYDKFFIAPTVFDEITNYDKLDDGTYYVYGSIDGINSKYDGENFFRMDKLNVVYPQKYILVKNKISKR